MHSDPVRAPLGDCWRPNYQNSRGRDEHATVRGDDFWRPNYRRGEHESSHYPNTSSQRYRRAPETIRGTDSPENRNLRKRLREASPISPRRSCGDPVLPIPPPSRLRGVRFSNQNLQRGFDYIQNARDSSSTPLSDGEIPEQRPDTRLRVWKPPIERLRDLHVSPQPSSNSHATPRLSDTQWYKLFHDSLRSENQIEDSVPVQMSIWRESKDFNSSSGLHSSRRTGKWHGYTTNLRLTVRDAHFRLEILEHISEFRAMSPQLRGEKWRALALLEWNSEAKSPFLYHDCNFSTRSANSDKRQQLIYLQLGHRGSLSSAGGEHGTEAEESVRKAFLKIGHIRSELEKVLREESSAVWIELRTRASEDIGSLFHHRRGFRWVKSSDLPFGGKAPFVSRYPVTGAGTWALEPKSASTSASTELIRFIPKFTPSRSSNQLAQGHKRLDQSSKLQIARALPLEHAASNDSLNFTICQILIWDAEDGRWSKPLTTIPGQELGYILNDEEFTLSVLYYDPKHTKPCQLASIRWEITREPCSRTQYLAANYPSLTTSDFKKILYINLHGPGTIRPHNSFGWTSNSSEQAAKDACDLIAKVQKFYFHTHSHGKRGRSKSLWFCFAGTKSTTTWGDTLKYLKDRGRYVEVDDRNLPKLPANLDFLDIEEAEKLIKARRQRRFIERAQGSEPEPESNQSLVLYQPEVPPVDPAMDLDESINELIAEICQRGYQPAYRPRSLTTDQPDHPAAAGRPHGPSGETTYPQALPGEHQRPAHPGTPSQQAMLQALRERVVQSRKRQRTS